MPFEDDDLWRSCKTSSSFVGVAELEDGKLLIRCEDVAAEYGADATILDDGRTVGVCAGDRLAFGVVVPEGKTAQPIAVNVFLRPKTKRKAAPAEEAALWAGWGDTAGADTFDYSFIGKKSKRREAEDGGDAAFDHRLPKDVRGPQTGVVKSQSFNSGNFFIQCAAAMARYGRDVTLRYADIPQDLGIGDAVIFEIDPPRTIDFPPYAQNVCKASGEKALEIVEKCRQDRKVEKGSGKGGYGGISARNRKGPMMSMSGIVKKRSMITDRLRVLCQDISDVYGKDCEIPREEEPPDVELKCGDRISFEVDEPEEGSRGWPLARSVRLLAGRGAGALGSSARRARMSAVVDAGDGEEDADDVEDVQEQEDEDVADDEEEPAGHLEASYAEAEADGRREAEVDDDVPAEGNANGVEELEGSEPSTLKNGVDDHSASAGGVDPDSVDGWIRAQSCLFGDLPQLQRGWVRMRSKTKGLVYYYNVESGQSATTEPRLAASQVPPPREPDPTSVDGWQRAQQRLFPGLHLPPGAWIRMRSKSKGLVYFYNVDTGESSSKEPRK